MNMEGGEDKVGAAGQTQELETGRKSEKYDRL